MGYPTKIATCCYCGTRSTLVLKGRVQHELACARCGAPLHELKMLPKARKQAREVNEERRRPAVAHRPPPKTLKPTKPTKRKKRKGFLKSIFEEAIDLVEDIFD